MKIGIYQVDSGKIKSNEWMETIQAFETLIFGDFNSSSRWMKSQPLALIACIRYVAHDIKGVNKKFIIDKSKLQDLTFIGGDPIRSNLYIIGYKMGSYQSNIHYHSSKGGVNQNYRRSGIAWQLHQYAEKIVSIKGVQKFTFNTFPAEFNNMVLFGLTKGFFIVNTIIQNEELKVTFQKNFSNKLPEPLSNHKELILKESLHMEHHPENFIPVLWNNNQKMIDLLTSGHRMVGWRLDHGVWNVLFTEFS